MYLELHHRGAKSLIGSVYKHIDGVYDPETIEEEAGFALQNGPSAYAFAVSLFRVEAIWIRHRGRTCLAAADGEFCAGLHFSFLNEDITDISTALVGDTISYRFADAERWARAQLELPYVACAVVLDTLGVRAAWWRDYDEIVLIAQSARCQGDYLTT